jgi:aminoglycoside/choline kinase family phosphotransferase
MMECLGEWLPGRELEVTPASSDASFRRYFRVAYDGISRIVMDAPPDREDCRPFIAIAAALRQLGLQVPQVLAVDLEKGFLLLTDLGPRQYLAELTEASVERLYADALDALVRLQRGGDRRSALLPHYDEKLLYFEMELFREWYLSRYLGITLEAAEQQMLDSIFAILGANALEQPKVWVHRDYHSRNLLVTAQENPGILDFQGAVIGPVSYDLASLLRDCYIAWPRQRVEHWALQYRARLLSLGCKELGDDPATFLRWFDLMGVQRHLKAIGIFARLYIRDGKPGYLADIPRTMAYVLEVSDRYPELAKLNQFLRRPDLAAIAA